ncbi:hypothetical protein F2Q70_00029677 [Brassica cretica]|uniref:Uncharacterized protein n=1 Tax=Brassica cretica TaxID=69181 RepID=A0A8S9FQ12_BRACR|nr:hypothetical protein F2Q70_00029677 [Brassica cretica]
MEGSSYRKFSFSWGKGAVPKIGPRVLRSGEPGCLLAGTQRPEGSNPNYVIMVVDEHNEQPEATPREVELQRQLDGIQSQVTELNRARVEVAENPELSSEVQSLKEKLDEHSKQLEQSAEKLKQLCWGQKRLQQS